MSTVKLPGLYQVPASRSVAPAADFWSARTSLVEPFQTVGNAPDNVTFAYDGMLGLFTLASWLKSKPSEPYDDFHVPWVVVSCLENAADAIALDPTAKSVASLIA